LTLFTGQFLLLFLAMSQGLSPGLASVTQQMQVFFTVLLAAVWWREIPTKRQSLGMTIAFAGLALIGLRVGSELKLLSLALALGGAMSWAVGNMLVKSASEVPIFALVVWASLIPPVPALVVSSIDTGSFSFMDAVLSLMDAVLSARWLSIAAAIYLGALATIWGYATWARLLQRYPAGTIAPFALLAPCAGVLSSSLVFGEVFSPVRYAGMGLICAGLAIVLFPDSQR
jgi:O-acetylserine/cysteine efflux transporter